MTKKIIPLVFTAVGFAMGIAFVTTSVLPDTEPPVVLLGIGLVSLGFASLQRVAGDVQSESG